MVNKTDIYIYAHWVGMEKPKEIEVLTASGQQELMAAAFKFGWK